MRAIGSCAFVGLLAVALTACGGDSNKKSPNTGGGPGKAEAGAGTNDQGDAGSEPTDGGNGPGVQGGRGGTSTRAGAGGAATNGGGSSGTPHTGGMPATGGTSAAGSGGSGSGGTPSAGMPGAGTSSAAGTGTTVTIEPPPDCSSVSQTGNADACSYEYTCDGRTHFDSCTRDIDGIWACECGTFSDPTRYFELDGVEAPEACAVIARACESDVTASPTRTCVTKEHGVEDDTCSAHATCGHVLDFEPGVVLREVEHYRTKCKLADWYIEDGYDCSCQGGAFDRIRQTVTGPSIDAVCDPMLAYCTSEMTPVFTEPVCGFGEPSGAVDQDCPTSTSCFGCLMSQECGKAGQLSRDVAMVSFENATYRYVVCLPDRDDYNCTCRSTLDGLYGDQSISQAVLDECRNSRAVCTL